MDDRTIVFVVVTAFAVIGLGFCLVLLAAGLCWIWDRACAFVRRARASRRDPDAGACGQRGPSGSWCVLGLRHRGRHLGRTWWGRIEAWAEPDTCASRSPSGARCELEERHLDPVHRGRAPDGSRVTWGPVGAQLGAALHVEARASDAPKARAS